MRIFRLPTLLWLVVSLLAVSSFVGAQGSPNTSGGGKISLAALWKKFTQKNPQKAAPQPPSSLDFLEEHIPEVERPRIRQLWNSGVAANYIHPVSGKSDTDLHLHEASIG